MTLFFQLLVNGVVAASHFALVAVGFSLILAVARMFHFAHGATYAVAGYILYWAVTLAHLPLGVGIGIAITAGVAFGAGCDLAVYRPLRRLGASHMSLLLASLAIFILALNVLPLEFGSEVHLVYIPELSGAIQWGSVVIRYIDLLAIGVSIVTILALIAFLRWTATGHSIRAVASSPEMAQILGINVNGIILRTYVVASLAAAPDALIYAMDKGVTPSMGLAALFGGAIATIVGGVGSVPGAAAAALLLGVAENLGVYWLASSWQQAIGFAILMIVLFVRPTGLARTRLWKAEV